VVIAIGVNSTQALVISQVVLSLVLPVPVVALLIFTSRRSLMGELVNHPLISAASWLCGAVILSLNLVLLLQTVGVRLPL
jgi:manganese transport protein